VTPRELSERAALLILGAAREDFDDPPYVLHMRELPEPFASLPVGGWAAPADDLRFKNLIHELIGWSGRRPCIVVGGDDWHRGAGVAVHEISHILATPHWTFSDPDERPIGEPLAALGLEMVANDTNGDISREMHGLQFHRAICHLLGRVPFDPRNGIIEDHVVAGDHYGWPDWWTIRRAFSSEVRKHIDEPIRLILESDPPEEAVQLFSE